MTEVTLYILSVLASGPSAIDQSEMEDLRSCRAMGSLIVTQKLSEHRYKAVSYKCIEHDFSGDTMGVWANVEPGQIGFRSNADMDLQKNVASPIPRHLPEFKPLDGATPVPPPTISTPFRPTFKP